MKNLKRMIACTLLLAFSQSLFAAGWSGAAKIIEIYPSAGSNGVLIKHGSMPNPDNCSSPTYYLLSKDNPLFTEIFALLASAQARQSLINLQLVNCGGNGNSSPLIYQVIAQ